MMPVFTIFGDIKRINRATRLDSESITTLFGDVRYDFTRTSLEPGDHRVRIFTAFGDIKLRLPEGVGLSIDGFALFSDVEVETERSGEEEMTGTSYESENFASAPIRLHLTVFGLFGDLELKRVATTGQANEGATYLLDQRDIPPQVERYERDSQARERRD